MGNFWKGQLHDTSPHQQCNRLGTNSAFLFNQVFFVAELLTISALCLAKCSVVALVLRVLTFEYEQSLDRIVCYGLLFLNVLWGLGSVAGLVVDCEVNGILTNKNIDRCPAQVSVKQYPSIPISCQLMLVLGSSSVGRLSQPWISSPKFFCG